MHISTKNCGKGQNLEPNFHFWNSMTRKHWIKNGQKWPDYYNILYKINSMTSEKHKYNGNLQNVSVKWQKYHSNISIQSSAQKSWTYRANQKKITSFTKITKKRNHKTSFCLMEFKFGINIIKNSPFFSFEQKSKNCHSRIWVELRFFYCSTVYQKKNKVIFAWCSKQR